MSNSKHSHSAGGGGEPVPSPDSRPKNGSDDIVIASHGRVYIRSILTQSMTPSIIDGGPKGGVLCRAPLQLAPEVKKLLSLDWSLEKAGRTPGPRRHSSGERDQCRAKNASEAYLSMSGHEQCFVEFVCVLRSNISLRPQKIVAVGDLEPGETHSKVQYIADIFRAHGVRIANARQNIGKAKFAFNSLQHKFLPRCYAPPPEVAKGGHKT